jgi:hypothetical protein
MDNLIEETQLLNIPDADFVTNSILLSPQQNQWLNDLNLHPNLST